MTVLLLLSTLLLTVTTVVVLAEDNDIEDTPIGKPEAKSGYESSGYGYQDQSPQVFYGGQYGGRCGNDGFYYNDENSFVMCNHGIAYVQQCAPGTRNGMASALQSGGFFTHAAFCDVNLVDFGYAAFHSQRGGDPVVAMASSKPGATNSKRSPTSNLRTKFIPTNNPATPLTAKGNNQATMDNKLKVILHMGGNILDIILSEGITDGRGKHTGSKYK